MLRALDGTPRRLWPSRIIATLLLFSATSGAFAANLEQLKYLIDSEQYQAAFTMALELRPEYEGDNRFDFYYGVAAIENGQVNEGVFALERVVYNQPKHQRARLELAHGYYLQGDDVRARRAFEQVLKVNPPAKVQQNIEQFLAAIRLRETRLDTTARAYIEVEGGSDSNINAGPNSPIADSSLPWVLDNNVLEQSDSFAGVLMGGRVLNPISQHTSLFANLDANFRQHASKSEYDNSLFTLQGGGQWQFENQRRRLALLLQQFVVDDETSRNLVGLTADNTWLQSGQQQITASFSMLDLSYPNIPIRDSMLYTLGLQWMHDTNGTSYAAALSLGKEVSDDDGNVAQSQADRTLYNAQVAGNWKLSDMGSWGAKLSTSRSQYSAPYLFGVLPKRDEILTSLEVSYTHLLGEHWQLRMSGTYSENSTNIDMFDYTRTQAKLGLRYEL